MGPSDQEDFIPWDLYQEKKLQGKKKKDFKVSLFSKAKSLKVFSSHIYQVTLKQPQEIIYAVTIYTITNLEGSEKKIIPEIYR